MCALSIRDVLPINRPNNSVPSRPKILHFNINIIGPVILISNVDCVLHNEYAVILSILDLYVLK